MSHLFEVFTPTKCPACGACCMHKNKLKRFNERHPIECQRRKAEDQKRTELAKHLAQGTKCLDEEPGITFLIGRGTRV